MLSIITWSAGGVWQLGCSALVPQHCCTAPKSEAGIVHHTRVAPVPSAPAPWARCAVLGHPVHAAQGSHTELGVLGRGAEGVGSSGGFLSLLEARGLLGVGVEQPQAHGGRGLVHGFACAQRALAPVLRPGGLWLLSPPSPLAPCARRKISSVPAAGRKRRSCGSWSG